MHRTSPVVVIYALFLLIAQYLYCMRLNENELPSKHFEEIGFVRYSTYPCLPLLLKTLFTISFWLTLRQMIYETTLDRQTSTLAHLAAPFQVTVSAATTDLGQKKESKKSKIILKAGAAFKSVILQLWIWIVVFALFACAIYGRKMTIIRITFMSLFLIFAITFHVSEGHYLNCLNKIYKINFFHFNEVILATLEKNYVWILGDCHWFFNVDIDSDLYISV